MGEIKKVGVLGAGLMGHGIAQVTATAGYDVLVRELDQAKLDKGIGRIEKQLARAVEKGRLEQSAADEIRGRITGTLDYADFADCDLVIEAITEDLGLKLALWQELDGIVKDDAIFATNTSSLSVVEQAAATKRAGQFVGFHFFSPAQVMKLVEVIKAITTADEIYEQAYAFAQALGKKPVRTPDRAGFIVNRLLIPFMVDAIRAYNEGVGSIEEIDQALRDGAGHPMGPLTLADFIGLDIIGAATEALYDEFRDPRHAQPPILRKLLAAGQLGQKTGLGFYDYSGDKPVPNPGL